MPEYEHHAIPERFPCFRCGACCLEVTDVPDISDWVTAEGTCRYYSPDGCTCQIYENRPAICNVWRTYRNQYEKEGVSWDDFVYTNMLNCCLLRYLNEIPEPEDSPFYGKQEDIAAIILQDMARPRFAPEPPDASDDEPRIGKLAVDDAKSGGNGENEDTEPESDVDSKEPARQASAPSPEPIDLNGPLDLDVPDIGNLGNTKNQKIPARMTNKHRGELLR